MPQDMKLELEIAVVDIDAVRVAVQKSVATFADEVYRHLLLGFFIGLVTGGAIVAVALL